MSLSRSDAARGLARIEAAFHAADAAYETASRAWVAAGEPAAGPEAEAERGAGAAWGAAAESLRGSRAVSVGREDDGEPDGPDPDYPAPPPRPVVSYPAAFGGSFVRPVPVFEGEPDGATPDPVAAHRPTLWPVFAVGGVLVAAAVGLRLLGWVVNGH